MGINVNLSTTFPLKSLYAIGSPFIFIARPLLKKGLLTRIGQITVEKQPEEFKKASTVTVIEAVVQYSWETTNGTATMLTIKEFYTL